MIVTASPETLLEQAGMTAKEYLRTAIHEIDDVCGDGYAKAHPDLVGKFMSVAASDYNTAIQVKAFEEALSELTLAVQGVADKSI